MTWTTRTRYIAELVGADALVVDVGREGSNFTTYASHNLPVSTDRPWNAIVAESVDRDAVRTVKVHAELTDRRVARFLCVAPLVWRGAVVGAMSALRVQRPWDADGLVALTRSAELIALELAETHSRLWWQRAAESWQRRIQLVDQIRRDLGGAPDTPSIVNTAAKSAAALVSATGATVMLVDEEGKLVVRSAFGPHAGVVLDTRREIGEGISGWVAKHGQPLLLRGAVTDERFSGIDPSIAESLVVPLRTRGRVVGVISTRTAQAPDPYGLERLHVLDLVAGDVADVITRAQEAAALTDITKRLENDRREAMAMFDLARLAGIGADPEGDLGASAELIADAFAHDSVGIWTMDLSNVRLARRAARGYGDVLPGDLLLGADATIDDTLARQQPRLVKAPANGSWFSLRATSFILAPIVVGGQSAGLVVLGRRGHYEQFDFSLAMTIADILSSLVRRELAAELTRRSEIQHRVALQQMERKFVEEMSRVVYVLDACQRLLGKDRDLPRDLARAARDARLVMSVMGTRLVSGGPSEQSRPLERPTETAALQSGRE